ncbi:hypothetical protein [Thalassotalea mangrovi]|uniref:Ankyrin repeat domain-containing protein n=1 Tax=Thalassotalea mangrovi TaxID=2572245 RepID=A0A4U1B5K9_9GAMM|nr:hypothetical protein [Thalassotalea mangrovi]TKB45641.1 hypothetical protein E8M12_07685 [Thalassotalea mangrovi]
MSLISSVIFMLGMAPLSPNACNNISEPWHSAETSQSAVDINGQPFNSNYELLKALYEDYGKPTELIEALINQEITKQQEREYVIKTYGRVLLNKAVILNNQDWTKYLLDEGINPFEPSQLGHGVVITFINFGNSELMKVLDSKLELFLTKQEITDFTLFKTYCI